MLLLLSPSKTQDFVTSAPKLPHTIPALLTHSEELIHGLRRYSVKDLGKLMDISDKLATLNAERYQQFHTPFTPENAKQALFAFQGDVYEGLDAAHLSVKALKYVEKHLRIISGLYGLLRPLDLIQPYRLEMSIALPTKRSSTLYHFWKEALREHVVAELKTLDTDIVVNLASEEYSKALTLPAHARIITPQFKEKKGRDYKIIGLFAKKARGQMVRFIAEQKNHSPVTLLKFAYDGYAYNQALSSSDKPVFTRG